jgi:prepilin-type N-terminal cleavage/methylation domain-containing protein
MYINRPNLSKTNGFTLVEIAIVLVILGLLITGLIMPLAAQYDLKNYNETRTRVATIKEAIVGFAIVNGRLPCPADGTIASGVAGAGLEVCTVTSVAGVVPWATLGLPETDAWNRRLTYHVTQSFTDGNPDACDTSTTSFALCSIGDITVTDSAVNIATNIPVLIVSHGKNGFGAFLSNGTQISSAAGSTNEQENADADSIFILSETNLQTFDDVVEWVSPNVLFNRMVTAGRLP